MKIDGYYYINSKSNKAKAYIINSKFIIELKEYCKIFNINDIKISPRIANSARYIYFNDNSSFQTLDNENIDKIQKKLKITFFDNFLYKLESNNKYIIIVIISLIVSLYIVIKYFIPYICETLAFKTSKFILKEVDTKSYNLFLNQYYLSNSKINLNKKQHLHNLFQNIIQNDIDYDYKLKLHKSILGANAFALPNGTIIVTDDLIKLIKNDNEFIAVIAHEIGHIKHRDSIKMLYESSFIAIFYSFVTNDTNSLINIAGALPIILVNNGYSRQMESQADNFAVYYLKTHNIDIKYFINILTKLSNKNNIFLPKYLSTHPILDDRINNIKKN